MCFPNSEEYQSMEDICQGDKTSFWLPPWIVWTTSERECMCLSEIVYRLLVNVKESCHYFLLYVYIGYTIETINRESGQSNCKVWTFYSWREQYNEFLLVSKRMDLLLFQQRWNTTGLPWIREGIWKMRSIKSEKGLLFWL